MRIAPLWAARRTTARPAPSVPAADISRQVTGTPPTASAGPFPVNYGVFNPLAWLNPYAIPPGANDPTITVTPAHPLPIILVNGTTETQAYNWSVGAPVLA